MGESTSNQISLFCYFCQISSQSLEFLTHHIETSHTFNSKFDQIFGKRIFEEKESEKLKSNDGSSQNSQPSTTNKKSTRKQNTPVKIVKQEPDNMDYENEQILIKSEDQISSNFKIEEKFDVPATATHNRNFEFDHERSFKIEQNQDISMTNKVDMQPALDNSSQIPEVPVDKKKNHACIDCGRKFKRTQHLKQHVLMVHLKMKRPRVGCDFCEQTFANSSHQKRHIRAIHLKEKNVSCPQCDAKFAEKSICNWHIKKVHEHYRPNQCEFCPKKYFSRSDKIRHENVRHRGIYDSFKCPQCPLILKHKNSIKNHIKRVHEKAEIPIIKRELKSEDE